MTQERIIQSELNTLITTGIPTEEKATIKVLEEWRTPGQYNLNTIDSLSFDRRIETASRYPSRVGRFIQHLHSYYEIIETRHLVLIASPKVFAKSDTNVIIVFI